MSDRPLLEVRALHAYYGQSHILQGVDLELGSQPLAVLGRNGMGKTTLCLALTGLLPTVRGSVRFRGQELIGQPPHRIAALGIGYVPQGRRVFPSLTVEEHLRLVPRRRVTAGEPWTPERIYDLFPRLAERRRQPAGTLSGGEQQMLAIARALLTNPQLLIMDEPSEGLAPIVVEQLVSTLRHLAELGLAILLVEQRLAVATAVARRIAIMLTGRIALETTAEQLLLDPALQQRYLGVSARKVA
ncbi:MAG: ABC transporter ATP-binding protein [Thermomicrobium sp.]|nr:ABC transporter ATP-binding protein [Thermomicrobium sp.]MDW8006257.1 ABC transporter ATP-binding protein [Thermomicrobium sp.]